MKETIFAFLSAFLINSTALAEGNWKAQATEERAYIAYQRDVTKDGFRSFSAAVDDLVKNGAISRLTTVDITVLLAVDRKLDAEVKEMLNRDWPDEFKAAQRSAGNMHNPALAPIYGPFVESLRKTTLMTEISTTLSQHGLRFERIGLEKFSFVDRDGFRPFWGFAYFSVEAIPETTEEPDVEGASTSGATSKN